MVDLRRGSRGGPGGVATSGRGAVSDDALQYSHVGRSYLLGYGKDFFGIWDRAAPGAPMRRFPRTDGGWRAAWSTFESLEPERIEVGLTPGVAAGTPAETTPAATTTSPGTPSHAAGTAGGPSGRAAVSPAWWLLPILFGWLGGLIAYLQVRRMDRGMATAMLALGILDSLLIVVWLLG